MKTSRGAGPSGNAEPNVFVTTRCNLSCVFCSARGEDRAMTAAEIDAVLDGGHPALAVEGGEPLLDPRLEARVRRAVRAGSREIMLFTNGALLTPERARALLGAGVTRFNFNLPAHTAALHDRLTGTAGQLPARLAAIRAAVRLAPPGSVIVTFVVNSLNYRTLPAFAAFAAAKLKGIFYLSLNFVKVKGRVKADCGLVPRLTAVRPYLRRAAKAARAAGLEVMSDGVPLCLLKDLEDVSVDPHKFMRGDQVYMGEKRRAPACAGCRLACLCAGPRADYLKLYGDSELRASGKDPKTVIAAVLRRRGAGRE